MSSPGAQRRFLSAFGVKSFRFQFGADLLASWAFEMETLILGWFILVATGSPLMLSVFAALNFGGTLLSPFFGVLADRVDRRNFLICLRLVYTMLALLIMILGFGGEIQPWHVFVIAGLAGLVRPSDLVARNTLLADVVPSKLLRNALGFSRTTLDSAKIVGALLGAGLFSTMGSRCGLWCCGGILCGKCCSRIRY